MKRLSKEVSWVRNMNNETRSTFETLEAWKMARNLRKEIARLVKAFPQEEKFRLTDQMIRTSRSITANIAEGHGRYHQNGYQILRYYYSERRKKVVIARSEATWQSPEIASLRSQWHSRYVKLFMTFTISAQTPCGGESFYSRNWSAWGQRGAFERRDHRGLPRG